MAIISILAALLLPALQRAVESARAAACLSQLRQMGIAARQYVDDAEGWVPPAQYMGSIGGNQHWRWCRLMSPWMEGQMEAMAKDCPSEHRHTREGDTVYPYDYGWNDTGFGQYDADGDKVYDEGEDFRRASQVGADTIWIMDSTGHYSIQEHRTCLYNTTGHVWYDRNAENSHLGFGNILLFDVHASRVKHPLLPEPHPRWSAARD